MQTLVIKCSDGNVTFHFLGSQEYPTDRSELGVYAQDILDKAGNGRSVSAYGLADSSVLDQWYEQHSDSRHSITIDGSGNITLPVP